MRDFCFSQPSRFKSPCHNRDYCVLKRLNFISVFEYFLLQLYLKPTTCTQMLVWNHLTLVKILSLKLLRRISRSKKKSVKIVDGNKQLLAKVR